MNPVINKLQKDIFIIFVTHFDEHNNMKEKVFTTVIKEGRYDELSPEQQRVVDRARAMTANSYAPYSGFHVGAAIEMANGDIVEGANQENAAFPSGTCAERTACYHASATHPGMAMKRIALAAAKPVDNTKDTGKELKFTKMPISPCGACRQALLEYETLHGPIEVIMYGEDTVYVFPSVASTLTYSFSEF